jgi:hypothetical protein
MDWEAAKGWHCEYGDFFSVLEAGPLSLTVHNKPGAWVEREWFWLLGEDAPGLKEDSPFHPSRLFPEHDDSDPGPYFDWVLHFKDEAVKVMLGCGCLPLDLDPADARRVALAGAVELLNELAAKLAAAGADGDGGQAGSACSKARGNCNGC